MPGLHKAMLIIRTASILCFMTFIASAKPVHLRCESRVNPLGIDAAQPTLSWQSDSTQRNWKQSAYEILVATSPDELKSGKGNIWDSGRQKLDESVGIPYGGPAVESRKRYYWTVRVWDAQGHMSTADELAWWEMGLLERSNWNAKWIRWENPEEQADKDAMTWIWAPGQDAAQVKPGTVAVFHYEFDTASKPARAALVLMARGNWKASVNGHDAGWKNHWYQFDRREISDLLVAGKNTVDITVTAAPPEGYGPPPGGPGAPVVAALAAVIKLHYAADTYSAFPPTKNGRFVSTRKPHSLRLPSPAF